MEPTEPTIVTGHDGPNDSAVVRLEAHSANSLVELVDDVDDPSVLSVAVDRAVTNDDVLDRDALVALVSVLVTLGVRRFETDHPQVVRRVLDTHSAISAGDIAVLEP
ncbi:MAG: hypothetical protein R8J94_21420 [Acidimicrobiia bacterium]|nr:hypothetical protein [Acidimicrobiia bacterium]